MSGRHACVNMHKSICTNGCGYLPLVQMVLCMLMRVPATRVNTGHLCEWSFVREHVELCSCAHSHFQMGRSLVVGQNPGGGWGPLPYATASVALSLPQDLQIG